MRGCPLAFLIITLDSIGLALLFLSTLVLTRMGRTQIPAASGWCCISTRLKYLLLCGSVVVFPSRRGVESVKFWHHMLKDRVNIVMTGELRAQLISHRE